MTTVLPQVPTPATAAAPSLTPDLAEQLGQLRDIHLPGSVSWWPPAPGWWILLVVILITAVGLVLMEIRRRRALKYRALRELATLMGGPTGQLDTWKLAAELCVLIRRIVLVHPGGRYYASVHGADWGDWLAADPNGMPREVAHFIASSPYAEENAAFEPADNGAPARQELIDAAEHWIRRHA